MRFGGLVVVVLVACSGSGADDVPDLGPRPPVTARAAPRQVERINPRLLRRFHALRAVMDDHGAAPIAVQVGLGRMLYADPRLSRGGTVSCATCHPLDAYGVDHTSVSIGSGGRRGMRNAPSVYNAAGGLAQFWDGRAATVEDQAKQPMLGADEMAMPSPASIEEVLRSIPGYRPAFAAAFPGDPAPISFDHAARAIGAFERTLVTPARWDRYLGGDDDALSPAELDGMKLFSDLGCVRCHTGELVGGSMFQRVGVMLPWPNQDDPGRFTVTHVEADRMRFKVPSLRNVAMTAPYFHDGSVAVLGDAVRMMARHQLGEELDDREVASIVAWLGTLTGAPPDAELSPPILPPDGPMTAARAERPR